MIGKALCQPRPYKPGGWTSAALCCLRALWILSAARGSGKLVATGQNRSRSLIIGVIVEGCGYQIRVSLQIGKRGPLNANIA